MSLHSGCIDTPTSVTYTVNRHFILINTIYVFLIIYFSSLFNFSYIKYKVYEYSFCFRECVRECERKSERANIVTFLYKFGNNKNVNKKKIQVLF